MNAREGLLDILGHRAAGDQLYWAPLIDGYLLRRLYPGLSQSFASVTCPLDFDCGPASEDRFEGTFYERLIALYRSTGAQVWLRGISPIKAELSEGSFEWIVDREAGVSCREFRLPSGTLTEQWITSPHTSFRTEYLIKDDGDYKLYGDLVQAEQYYPAYAGVEILESRIGPDGLVVVSGLDLPLVRLFRSCNPEKLLVDMMTQPSNVRWVMDLIHEKNIEGYRLISQSPARVIVLGGSYLTTKLISPGIFEEYVIGYCRDYADIIHESGKVFLIHMCGSIRRLLPFVPLTGADGLECVTPPPVGDVEVFDALEELGKDLCIIGGLGPDLLTSGSPLEIDSQVKFLWGKLRGGTNFILGSGDAVPYDTPLENLVAVGKAVKDIMSSNGEMSK